MRNFGIQNVTSRFASGAQPRTGSHYATGARRNSNFPSSGLPLKRGKFTQAVIDIIAIGFGVLFACVGGLAIVVSIFCLLFVRF